MSEKQIQDYLVNRIVDQLTTFLIEDKGMGISEALEAVYSSHVYDLLQIKEGDLFSQSPSYVYELLKKELETTHYFQQKLDEESDRLWESGVLDQERLDEIRHMDLHVPKNETVSHIEIIKLDEIIRMI